MVLNAFTSDFLARTLVVLTFTEAGGLGGIKDVPSSDDAIG